ncbi:hypothetical protein LOAG_09136 [Loa loa]|uniref:ShKT domain-containing protein n=2 Tax=Loa loa TaxID=7209 RepID=A0A1S0TSH1_LOALO|nr:hypothetical protein LOAG_09136 [Loa loa]EFO19360.1 hypothetical protein LOAG_09136 [Loa loa]
MASFSGYDSLAIFLLFLLSQYQTKTQAMNSRLTCGMNKELTPSMNKEKARGMDKELARDINKKVPQAMKKDLAHGTNMGLPQSMNKELARGIDKELARDINEKVTQDMKKDLAHDTNMELSQNMNKEMAQGMNREVVPGENEKMDQDVNKKMAQAMDVESQENDNSTSQLCYDSSALNRDSDCTKYYYLCDNDVYYNLMTWQCPLTCGRCSDLIVPSFRTGILANGTCVDLNGPNGRSDCRKYITLCRDPRYISLMAIECPKTCRYCSNH